MLLEADNSLTAHIYQALLADEKGLRRYMDLKPENLINLALGRKSLTMPPQDLVYSIGLIDYFRPTTAIYYEPQRINLFAECTKGADPQFCGRFRTC